jgi:hypothetical protein
MTEENITNVPVEEKSSPTQLHATGNALYDEGEKLLAQAKKIRSSADKILDDVKALQKKYTREHELANLLFLSGHDKIDEARKYWDESIKLSEELTKSTIEVGQSEDLSRRAVELGEENES